MEERMPEIMEIFKEKASKVKNLLDQTPKKEPCNIDLKIWVEDVKKEAYKRVDDSYEKNYNPAKKQFARLKSTLESILLTFERKSSDELGFEYCDKACFEEDLTQYNFDINEDLTFCTDEVIETYKNNGNMSAAKIINKRVFGDIIKLYHGEIKSKHSYLKKDLKEIEIGLGHLISALQKVHSECDNAISQIRTEAMLLSSTGIADVINLEKATCCIMYKLVNNGKYLMISIVI